MLSLMLEFRVWSQSRPAHESQLCGEKVLVECEEIERRELEQERARESLLGFINSVRNALAALHNL